jgi:hypothetical protein
VGPFYPGGLPLANVLLAARDNKLSVTGTDLEVELVASTQVNVQQNGDITVPGRKLLDIFRSFRGEHPIPGAPAGGAIRPCNMRPCAARTLRMSCPPN